MHKNFNKNIFYPICSQTVLVESNRDQSTSGLSTKTTRTSTKSQKSSRLARDTNSRISPTEDGSRSSATLPDGGDSETNRSKNSSKLGDFLDQTVLPSLSDDTKDRMSHSRSMPSSMGKVLSSSNYFNLQCF